jgi:predicted alpha/beta hydrolase family esterase
LINILTVPGLWNSGPQHWQTHWEAKHPNVTRVLQRDFDHPNRDEWVRTLDAAVRACAEPPILASHSLGCSLVGQWVKDTGGQGVRGAFLVAPSDVEAPGYPEEGRSFLSMPLVRLPFPSMVVASTNDEYVSVERARQFAEAWGARIVFIGDAGHINGNSGHGPWPEGEEMLFAFARAQRTAGVPAG